MQQSEIAEKIMSPADFEMLGMHHVAYVKKIGGHDCTRFGVYAANGAEIALMDVDRDVAFATVRQHDMEPVSVH
jgi:hypothetical protein